MKKLHTVLVGASSLLALASASASAPARAASYSPHQASITVGGGVADFVGNGIRAVTTPAGAWDARLTLGTRSYVGFEANYLGTAGGEIDPVAKDPVISTTQVTGAARLNLSRSRVQPFVTTGVGWINLHSYGRDEAPVATSNFAHNDNGVVIPVGTGLSGYIGRHGLIDARFTYNFVTGAKDFSIAHQRPDMWVAQLSAGYAF